MSDGARSADPAVQAQLDRLAALAPAGTELGLERICALLDRLGRPQDGLPPVLHVAGTNGKGSTCAFLRAALEASGLSVHVFTSPHLVRFNERIRISGTLIEDSALAALLDEVLGAGSGIAASFFEVTTAAALLAFARSPADACIIEVGLGGRLDGTNVVDRPLSCGIASLALDHQMYLGHRLADIAAEKAGIARAGVPLVSQYYPPAVAARIGEVARRVGARWLPRGGRWDLTIGRGRIRYHDQRGELDLPLPRLAGRHQALNAALAVAMLRHQQRLAVPPSALTAAMGWADWPGRLQSLGEGPLTRLLPAASELWVDGGHNPAAARQVAAFVRRQFTDGRPLHLLFASLATKDAQGMLEPFAGSGATVHCLPIEGHSSRDPAELAALAGQLGLTAVAHRQLSAAVGRIASTAVGPQRLLAFGSLYLVGQILAANQQQPR